MLGKSERLTPAGVALFVLRNLVLLSLVANAFLHFREELNLVFVISSCAMAVFLAVWMERLRFRFVLALLITALAVFGLRFLFFLFFGIFIPLDRGLEADFLYFYFDRDFFPSLLPCAVVWLFNFSSLRHIWFVHIEAGLNALILLAVFATEANFNITIYHPTFFGIYLTLFVLAEIAAIVLGWRVKRNAESGEEKKARGLTRARALAYLWVLVPLLLLFVFYFILMSMYNNASARSRGGLMESTLLRFDFSKYIRLESEIKLSDDLVLIFRKNGYAQRLLLRRFVLSKYDPKGGFYASETPQGDDMPVTVPDSVTTLEDPAYRDREAVTQDYFFVNLDPTSLIAMNYPVKITPLTNWDKSSFLRIYRVVSKVSQYSLYEEYAETKRPVMDPSFEEFYTRFGNDKKIKALAEEVTSFSLTYFEKVLAVHDFLRNNYLYSLKPGLAEEEDGGNQLHRFLFTSKKGYCSYFAFAMALMLRSIGIPARVAVGFFANPDWEVLNFYEIRANQAHAWVEVYFGDLGWIEFDPTSTTLAPGEDISFMLDFELSDKLKKLISEILNNEGKLTEEESASSGKGLNARAIADFVIFISSWLVKYWYLLLPSMYLLLLSIAKLRHILSFALAGSPRPRIKHLYRHAFMRLHEMSLARRPDESLLEFARRLSSETGGLFLPFVRLTEEYLKAVFAEVYAKADYGEAKSAYREFKASCHKRFALPLRLLGYLNPAHMLKKP